MAQVFGVIVAGRLPQGDCVEVSPGKFLINIMEADAINHLVVFLTGVTPLPQGKLSLTWSLPWNNLWL